MASEDEVIRHWALHDLLKANTHMVMAHRRDPHRHPIEGWTCSREDLEGTTEEEGSFVAVAEAVSMFENRRMSAKRPRTLDI